MAVRVKERALSIVADNGDLAPVAVESISERVKRLQAEARGLAREHILALKAAMEEVERLAAEVAAGGEAYPAGVRDIARRLVEDCETKGQTIAMLVQRG
jgi:hypothetical protein